MIMKCITKEMIQRLVGWFFFFLLMKFNRSVDIDENFDAYTLIYNEHEHTYYVYICMKHQTMRNI